MCSGVLGVVVLLQPCQVIVAAVAVSHNAVDFFHKPLVVLLQGLISRDQGLNCLLQLQQAVFVCRC